MDVLLEEVAQESHQGQKSFETWNFQTNGHTHSFKPEGILVSGSHSSNYRAE